MHKISSPCREAEVIEEGNEPDAFWEALGGKGDYSKIIRKGPVLDPRLFHWYYDMYLKKTSKEHHRAHFSILQLRDIHDREPEAD